MKNKTKIKSENQKTSKEQNKPCEDTVCISDDDDETASDIYSAHGDAELQALLDSAKPPHRAATGASDKPKLPATFPVPEPSYAFKRPAAAPNKKPAAAMKRPAAEDEEKAPNAPAKKPKTRLHTKTHEEASEPQDPPAPQPPKQPASPDLHNEAKKAYSKAYHRARKQWAGHPKEVVAAEAKKAGQAASQEILKGG